MYCYEFRFCHRTSCVKEDSMTNGTFRYLCAGDVILCREVYPESRSYGFINTRYPNMVIIMKEEDALTQERTKHSKKSETLPYTHSTAPTKASQ